MLRAQLQVTDQDARSISSVKGSEYLGQTAYTLDGRSYTYSSAGSSNLSAGLITQQGTATTSNHVNQTGVAFPVGTTQLTYTVGATDAAADLYATGYLSVNDTATTGINVYRIKSNTLSNAASSRSITVTLESDEGLTVATTTASKFSLYPGPFRGNVVMANATAPTGPIVNGVPNVAVTATYFYWSQVSGYAAVLSDGAIAKNTEGIPSNAVDGAVETRVDATVVKAVCYAPELTITAKYYPVILTVGGLGI